MLAVWGYIEADFRRDYGIRLVSELPRMSWREFKTLLNGLSPWGALATHYDAELKKQRAEDDDEAAVSGRKAEAASFWTMVTNVSKPKES